jgi:hypothetical protein
MAEVLGAAGFGRSAMGFGGWASVWAWIAAVFGVSTDPVWGCAIA